MEKMDRLLTEQVFVSDLLPTRCPILYQSLKTALNENGKPLNLLIGTKDIWCRDYMPIQIGENRFVTYTYNPDYLQKPHNKCSITHVDQISNFDILNKAELTNLNLVLDGGNVVKCGQRVVMTEKIFCENKNKTRSQICSGLEEAFQSEIIFLPWDKDEYLGHSDGIIHYAGDNKVLLTNYDDFDGRFYSMFRKILEKHFEVIPLHYDVTRKHKRSWAYVNFLQVGNLILVSQLGLPEDELAIQQIEEAFPNSQVVGIPSLEAVRKGGALNCISWNVTTEK